MTSRTCIVVYEDNHLLVIDKPAGMLTQPNDTNEYSAEQWAKDWIKKTLDKPGNVFLHAIHRLDKPVSGLVVFARTSKALSRLNESMRSQQYRKVYHATVEGVLSRAEGTLEHYLIHDDHRAIIATASTPQAQRAILQYKTLRTEGLHTVLEVELKTGRYHQIRAQLAAIGCPIVGDAKYGSRTNTGNVIALRHVSISFPHPTTKETLTISAL